MCTYVTATTPVRGSGLASSGWVGLAEAVVYFDHPQDAPLEHALCVDLRASSGDPSERVSVELDAESARRLAETILEILGDPEVTPLL